MSARLLRIQTQACTWRQHLLFAYGANMHPEQIRKRCSSPVRIGTAFLPDYRIGFYGHSEEWDGALETAIEADGCKLWGVVYGLSAMDWERLDLWQGARFDGTGMYFHYPVQIYDAQGILYEARMYKKDVLGEPRRPSNRYLEHILHGAQQNQLPQQYTESLLALPCKPAEYAVPIRAGGNPADRAGASCEACATAF